MHIRRWVLPRGVDEVFLMGGGSRNPELVRAIEAELAPVPVRSGEAIGMDPDAREAAAFALLAWAHLQGIPGQRAGGHRLQGPPDPGILDPWETGEGR